MNWWTTYPAEEGGGTILGNHLFFAARAGQSLAGEGWPADAAERAARLAPRVAPEPGSLERLVADARGLDAFALAAFREAWRRTVRVSPCSTSRAPTFCRPRSWIPNAEPRTASRSRRP